LNHAEWMQSKENGISSEVHKVQSRKQWWYRSIERAERSEAIICLESQIVLYFCAFQQ